MSGSGNEGGIVTPSQRLYDLLPAIYRKADEAGGYPLLGLMQVFEHVFADLEAGLPVLEEGWFVETCDLDRVPAIAAMIGTRLSQPLRPEHRARVADSLALRRRLGLASALPRLIRGASGWYALFATDLGTPAAAWPLPDLAGPRALMRRTAGQDAPQRAGSLRIWRLPVLHACGATPAPGAIPGRFTFDPLGYERPLWNVAGSALPMAAAPPVTALPVAVTRTMLTADLARSRSDWPDGVGTDARGPEDSLLYGPARGLAIRAWTAEGPGKAGGGGAWRTIPPAEITAGVLSDTTPVPPDHPALLSGPIAPESFVPGPLVLTVDRGDTRAEITLDLAPGMTMPALAAALSQALANPRRIVRQGAAPSTALTGLIVGTVDDRLAIVPCDGGAVPLTFAAPEPDPLALAGADRRAEALCTVAIDPALARRLTTAAPGSVLAFSGAGRTFAIPLPLASTVAEPDPETIAAALQTLLPDCFVCAAAGRVVIVPAPNPGPAVTRPAPDPSDLARDLGLVATLVIDPEAGVFAWPSGWGPPPVLAVDGGYAVAAELGGGSYPRPPGDGSAFEAPPDEVAVTAADEPGGLDAALLRWRAADIATAIRLEGGGTRTLATKGITLAAGQSLRIVSRGAAQACLVRPDSVLPITGPAETGSAARLVLDGATIAAGLAPTGRLDLALRDLTLIPPTGLAAIASPRPKPAPSPSTDGPSEPPTSAPTPNAAPPSGQAPPSSAKSGGALSPDAPPPLPPTSAPTLLRLDVVRCRVGPIDLEGFAGTLSVGDSVLSAMPIPAFDDPLLGVPGAFVTRMERSTLMGRATIAGSLDAIDTLFAASLTCSGVARFHHCFVAELTFPRSIEIDDESAAAVARCGTCHGIRALRLRRCHLPLLVLDSRASSLCLCDAPTVGTVSDCTSCRIPDCARTCPLRGVDQSWNVVGTQPDFGTENRYPLPGFARLSDENPPAILSGATDRDVIGAGNRAAPTARARDFEAALRENLLFGTGLDVVFES